MKKHFAIAILLILVFAVSVSTVLAETPIAQSFDTIGGIVTFGRYEQVLLYETNCPCQPLITAGGFE